MNSKIVKQKSNKIFQIKKIINNKRNKKAIVGFS